jgi:hypothetical protein
MTLRRNTRAIDRCSAIGGSWAACRAFSRLPRRTPVHYYDPRLTLGTTLRRGRGFRSHPSSSPVIRTHEADPRAATRPLPRVRRSGVRMTERPQGPWGATRACGLRSPSLVRQYDLASPAGYAAPLALVTERSHRQEWQGLGVELARGVRRMGRLGDPSAAGRPGALEMPVK